MISDPPCPICGQRASAPIATTDFGDKPHLPQSVSLHGCASCDFAFTWPRDPDGYRAYYAAVANDLTQRHGQYRNVRQVEIIAGLIADHGIRSVLDFGCGGGGLLHGLADQLPEVAFTGFDVNADFPSDLSNLRFTSRSPTAAYDLVIVSHVLEHIPDMDQITGLFDLVAAGGLIYIETPDPKRYGAFEQPHFAYYVDRLHINHFSQRAILKVSPSGFDVVAGGTYAMPYTLGEAYPAQYLVLRDRGETASAPTAIQDYLTAEARRWAAVRAELGGRRFLVYGFGDNLHRALAPGGPLHGLEDQIIAVIDRNAEALSSTTATFRFIPPTEVEEIDGGLIVCTVSQFSDLRAFFGETYPGSEVRYI
jgi:SAM-dependent methyltransferase